MYAGLYSFQTYPRRLVWKKTTKSIIATFLAVSKNSFYI